MFFFRCLVPAADNHIDRFLLTNSPFPDVPPGFGKTYICYFKVRIIALSRHHLVPQLATNREQSGRVLGQFKFDKDGGFLREVRIIPIKSRASLNAFLSSSYIPR